MPCSIKARYDDVDDDDPNHSKEIYRRIKIEKKSVQSLQVYNPIGQKLGG